MSNGIFLTGMPASGKTTLGKALSELTGIPFYDLDEEIEKHTGLSVAQVWNKYREPKFREIEHEVLQLIIENNKHKTPIYICALGGGAWTQQMNRTLVKTAGMSVFIDASVQILHKRLLKCDIRERPIIAVSEESDLKKVLETLISRRISTYLKAEKRVHIVDNIRKDLDLLLETTGLKQD